MESYLVELMSLCSRSTGGGNDNIDNDTNGHISNDDGVSVDGPEDHSDAIDNDAL